MTFYIKNIYKNKNNSNKKKVVNGSLWKDIYKVMNNLHYKILAQYHDTRWISY